MTSFQRLQDVYATLVTSYGRLIDVETTSCVYWVTINLTSGNNGVKVITLVVTKGRHNFPSPLDEENLAP